MPVYAYRCQEGHESELFVRGNPFAVGFKSPAITNCDKCGDVAFRVISPCGVSVDKEWVSEHIHPKGKPVLIKGKKHQKQLMKKYGLRLKGE